VRAIREEHEEDRGGEREGGPGRKTAEIARARQTDREAHLAARGAGQKLAQRQQIRKGLLVEPTAAQHELVAEVAEVGDRPPEGADAELEEGDKDLAERAHA
jgi:hypothetical protein